MKQGWKWKNKEQRGKSSNFNNIFSANAKKNDRDGEDSRQGNDKVEDDQNLELIKQEQDMAKLNFEYYTKNKGTQVELFELPMLMSACGYRVTP